MRLQEDVERRVAKEEAMSTGAYFGKTTLQIGMELEDKVYEEWKTWAMKRVLEIEQQRAAMYTGVERDLEDSPDNLSETESAMEQTAGSTSAEI